ncbi:MAG: rhodanese-like domain-containing protein, partial [Gammaproteobacteria bacterium]|nr:rhodanese-like domain-containing protein [Gammaproteobacteria bacterium]
YCNKGWRSALATQTAQNMGVENVLHMSGGFERWVEDIGRVEKTEK